MTRPAPRAGGGRAAFRFDRGGGGSRRRQAHEQGLAACKVMRWATLPCPLGKGRCGGAGATLFAPAGQKRYRVGAPDFGLSRGKGVCEAVCPSGDVWQARRGRGGRVAAACVPRSRRVSAAVPQGERRALPAPAQGINPLRIPFWGTARRFSAFGAALSILTSLAGSCTSDTSSPARREGWGDRRPVCGIPPCARASSRPAPPG